MSISVFINLAVVMGNLHDWHISQGGALHGQEVKSRKREETPGNCS
jgi:hypothetical protein